MIKISFILDSHLKLNLKRLINIRNVEALKNVNAAIYNHLITIEVL